MTSGTSDARLRARSELVPSLSLIAVAVNFWAIFTLLRYMPSLVLRLTSSEVIGVAGYVLTIALLETILLALPVALIGLALVRAGRHVHMTIYLAGAVVSLLFSFMPCAHDSPLAGSCSPLWPLLGLLFLLCWVVLIHLTVRRFPGWSGRIQAAQARLVPLGGLYLLLDLLAVLVVAARLLLGEG